MQPLYMNAYVFDNPGFVRIACNASSNASSRHRSDAVITTSMRAAMYSIM